MWSGWSSWGGARAMHCRTLHYGEFSRLKRVGNYKKKSSLYKLESHSNISTPSKWLALHHFWNSCDDIPWWLFPPVPDSVCVYYLSQAVSQPITGQCWRPSANQSRGNCLNTRTDQSEASIGHTGPMRGQETETSCVTLPGGCAQCQARLWSVNTRQYLGDGVCHGEWGVQTRLYTDIHRSELK